MTILLYMFSNLEFGTILHRSGIQWIHSESVHGRFLAGLLGLGVMGCLHLYDCISSVRLMDNSVQSTELIAIQALLPTPISHSKVWDKL